MRRPIRAAVVFLFACLFLVSTAPAGADEKVFKAQLICDTDGVAPFTDLEGSATISDNGDLKVKIHGLRPNTEYTCQIFCLIPSQGAAAPCSTDSHGKLNAHLPGLGRTGPLASGCGHPLVTVFVDDPDDLGDFCMTGYGSP